MEQQNRKTKHVTGKKKTVSSYYVVTVIILAFLAVFSLFPLYWIVTGSVEEKSDIIIESGRMVKWISATVSWNNLARLFKSKTKLFGIGTPMAIRWLSNSVFISAITMILACITAPLAGYVLAKKHFQGKRLIFSLFVYAMVPPKQVILIPLAKGVSDLGLIHSMWSSMFTVICPVVSRPFGTFMMRRSSENILVSLLETARIDGAGGLTTFVNMTFPIIRPGFDALAIFTFINSWSEYPLQPVMLTQNESKTIALGIASKLSEVSDDFGLIVAGAVLASVPVITVFLCSQKYFTQGVTMGAVKGQMFLDRYREESIRQG